MTGTGDSILFWLGAYALHSTLFLGAVWLVERLWKGASPMLLASLWRIALLAGLVTASLHAGGVSNPFARLAILPATVGAAPAAAVLTPSGTPPAPLVSKVEALPPLAVPPENVSPRPAETAALPPVGRSNTASSIPAPIVDWSLLAAVLLWLWAAIVSLLALRAAFMWWAAHRELRDRQPVVHGPLFERIQALAHDIGLRRLPQVSFSDRIAGPFTLPNGEICIPVWARERLPQRQLDAMLAHEMAHVLHRDSLWLAIGMAVGSVFFFQPLNLLARRRLANLAELAADDWAATRAGSGRPLAECISTFVNIAHARAHAHAHDRARAIATPEFAAAMAKPKSELVQRVERLLGNRYTNGALPMKTKLLVGACALAFSAAMPGLAAQAHDQPSPPVPLLAPEPVEAPEPPAAPEALAEPETPEPASAPEAAAASPETPPAPAVREISPEIPEWPETPEALAFDPAPAPEPQRSVSISHDDGRVRLNLTISRGLDYRLSALADGRIDLAPDGSGVRSIADGGYLDATLSRGLQTRRVRYTGEGGSIRREFWVGGQSRPWGPEADAFAADLMPILMRESGIGAKERVDWFLQQRGPDALLAEIGQIDSDSVQMIYTTRWFETTKLAPPMLERVLALAGDNIDSDSHLQVTLVKAWKTQQPSGRQLAQLIRAGESLDSDSHTFVVLDQVASAALADDASSSAWFDLVRSIDSDSHMQAALSKAVTIDTIGDARLAEVIRLAGADIDSDSHLQAVLSKSAPRIGSSDALARTYLDAARSIGSDSHSMAALLALAKEASLSPASWRALIEDAARVGSDSHKSALLTGIARRVPADAETAAAYRKAIASIGSRSHRAAAERAALP